MSATAPTFRSTRPEHRAARTSTASPPPRFYALARAAVALTGDAVWGIRAVSLISGMLLVPAVAVLALRIVGRRAAVLVALNPLEVLRVVTAAPGSDAAP